MLEITCPICGKPMHVADVTQWPSFPFCSRKCRIIDLGRWLDQEYRLSAPIAEDGGEEATLLENDNPPHSSA